MDFGVGMPQLSLEVVVRDVEVEGPDRMEMPQWSRKETIWIYDSYHRGCRALESRRRALHDRSCEALKNKRECIKKSSGWSFTSPSRLYHIQIFAVPFFATPPIFVTFGVIQVGAVTLAAVIFVAAMAVPS